MPSRHLLLPRKAGHKGTVTSEFGKWQLLKLGLVTNVHIRN